MSQQQRLRSTTNWWRLVLDIYAVPQSGELREDLSCCTNPQERTLFNLASRHTDSPKGIRLFCTDVHNLSDSQNSLFFLPSFLASSTFPNDAAHLPSPHMAAPSAPLPSNPFRLPFLHSVCVMLALISHWKTTIQTHSDDGGTGRVSRRDIEQNTLLITAQQSQVRGGAPTGLADNRRHPRVWSPSSCSDRHIKILLRTRREFLKLIRRHPCCSVPMKRNLEVFSCWLHSSCGSHWQVVSNLKDFISLVSFCTLCTRSLNLAVSCFVLFKHYISVFSFPATVLFAHPASLHPSSFLSVLQ